MNPAQQQNRLIIRPRGGGKTTEAIRIANETGAYLVVATQKEAARVAHLCVRFPVTFDELLNRNSTHAGFVRNIVIDNAEMLIDRIAAERGLGVDAITVTGQDA